MCGPRYCSKRSKSLIKSSKLDAKIFMITTQCETYNMQDHLKITILSQLVRRKYLLMTTDI